VTGTLKLLKDNLHKQARLYAELNELAGRKQEALVRNNLQQLEAITVREEQLILEAGHLEKERLGWSEQIGRALGRAAEEVTLAELAAKYPELESVRQELEGTVASLREAHELNAQLLQQALKVVDFTVGLLTQPSETTYARPGSSNRGAARRAPLVDRKI